MDDDVQRQTERIIAQTRTLIDGLTEQFGEALMIAKDFDRALQMITLAIDASGASREQLAIAVAFAVRRLWHKRRDVPRVSMN